MGSSRRHPGWRAPKTVGTLPGVKPMILAAFSCGLAALVHAAPPDAHAQFNPAGRRRPPAAAPGPARRPSPQAQPPGGARPPAGSSASAGTPPSTETLIARYAGIVLSQPGAAFPLQRLAELYRQRDGKLDALVADLERRVLAPGPDQWSARIALAGIQHQLGELPQAIANYERASAERPRSPVPLLALAELLSDQGDVTAALARYEQALPLLKSASDREPVLRRLMLLSLDDKDVAAARRHHRTLVGQAQGSFFVRGELGRELLTRGEFAAAVTEFQEVAAAAAGDNRVLAPALRDLGQAQAQAGNRTEALSTLRRGLSVAGAQAGIRREIYAIIVDLYRAEGRLRELVTELERGNPGDVLRLRMLGELYEETGQVERAATTYRQALSRDGRDLELRLKLVQLLQLQGELAAAVTEYEALIRAAPHNPDYVFRLAEALLQQGDRRQALQRLAELESRATGDEDVLAALVDQYERLGEADRALGVLQRLTALGTQDPRHLIALGERHWQDGDQERARRTWQRVLTVGGSRADAYLSLGEVYLEHGLGEEGLAALTEAAQLGGAAPKYRKALALALERTGASASSAAARRAQYERALAIWEELLENSAQDPLLARDARQHVVTLWGLMGTLDRREAPLARRLAGTPPDVEAGRLLAELQLRKKRYAAAQRTLQSVIGLAPGDLASLSNLERVLVLQRRLRPAIGVLERLVAADPKRAREYYQRMAQYAAELYADDEAITYAARAVELSPDDAEGHRRLGAMYRRRQQLPQAIAEFRQAIAKNDRLFPVYFELAELLLGEGELEEADRLLRRVVRAAPDEELVTRAARLSMQLGLGNGDLEELERELLPLALANPQRPLHRRLLVELYGALALPLVHQTRSGDPQVVATARAALTRIGDRAVKPLLDALGDEREEQRRIAIELLSHIRNPGAAPALFAFATSPAPVELRTRAMIAVGALADPAQLPRLEGLLVHQGKARADEADPVLVAAAWSVARMRSHRARPLLIALTGSDAPSLRALGALGLGLNRDHRSRDRLIAMARDPDWGPLPRAAAAEALGRLGDASGTEVLVELASVADPTVRGAAVVALARLRSEDAARILAEALVATDPEVRQAAAAGAVALTSAEPGVTGELMPPTESAIDVRRCLESLRPTGFGPAARVAALTRLTPALERASVAAVAGSLEGARVIGAALRYHDGLSGFLPLTEELPSFSPEQRAAVAEAADRIAAAVVPHFVALAAHPSVSVRSRAVELLARRAEPAARDAVVAAILDPEPAIQRAALMAVAERPDPAAAAAAARVLGEAEGWPARIWAAEALAAAGPAAAAPAVISALEQATLTNSAALVREAAMKALVAVAGAQARAVLERVARTDPEPRLRAAASQELAR